MKLQYFFLLIFAVFSFGACNSIPDTAGNLPESPNDPNPQNPPKFISEPKFTMAPNPDTPLAGILEFETDKPTRVVLQIQNQTDSWSINFDEFQTFHSLMVLGFHPGKTHSIQISIFDEDGNSNSEGASSSEKNSTLPETTLLVETDPLPAGFPPLQVVISNPAKMEPGFTLFNMRPRGDNFAFGNLQVIVNNKGEVVWYRLARGTDLRQLPNGNILALDPRRNLYEADMLGNVIRKWHVAGTPGVTEDSIPVDTLAFHHDVFPLPNGNFLMLSVEIRQIENYPTSETDPDAPTETAAVAGDVVVEFTPEGQIVQEWAMLDLLDPLRIGYTSLGGYWNSSFPDETDGTRDWSHGNSVFYDPTNNSIIVSLRQQDAVIKFSRATGDLIWIIGPHENWDMAQFGAYLFTPITPTAEAPFEWNFHQHAAMVTSQGNILMFDNGNFRASPFDPGLSFDDSYSRAVEFSIDEDMMEITQVWQFGKYLDPALFCNIVGDADLLPTTGNVLVTFGGIVTDKFGNPMEGGKRATRIIEVSHEEPAEVVFHLSIIDPTDSLSNGWFSYRAERIQSLYAPK